MSFRIEATLQARDDLLGIYQALCDAETTLQGLHNMRLALQATRGAFNAMSRSPLSGRKVRGDPLLREWIFPFAEGGCVVLLSVENDHTARLLAVRPAREDDWY